uniref:hypothetical protein n=1 Tax=Escherichia coli TaxID=562 RepID=UPI00278BB60E
SSAEALDLGRDFYHDTGRHRLAVLEARLHARVRQALHRALGPFARRFGRQQGDAVDAPLLRNPQAQSHAPLAHSAQGLLVQDPVQLRPWSL